MIDVTWKRFTVPSTGVEIEYRGLSTLLIAEFLAAREQGKPTPPVQSVAVGDGETKAVENPLDPDYQQRIEEYDRETQTLLGKTVMGLGLRPTESYADIYALATAYQKEVQVLSGVVLPVPDAGDEFGLLEWYMNRIAFGSGEVTGTFLREYVIEQPVSESEVRGWLSTFRR